MPKRRTSKKKSAKRPPAKKTQPRFVSRDEVIRIGRARGMDLNPKNLKDTLRNVPASWKKQTVQNKPFMVREDKISAVLIRVRTRSIVPKKYYTVAQLGKEAVELGLVTRYGTPGDLIQSWINDYVKNPKKGISKVRGIAWDYYDFYHRRLIPENVKKELFDYLRKLEIPKGYYTSSWFINEARQRGLNVTKASVHKKVKALAKLEKMKQTKRPSVVLHKSKIGNQLIFNKEIKRKLFRWLRGLREVEKFSKLGYVTPLTVIAAEFKLTVGDLHYLPGLQTIKIGNRAFVDVENAKYARDYLNEGRHRKYTKTTTLVPPAFKHTWRALDFWLLNGHLDAQHAARKYKDEVGFMRVVFEQKRPWKKLTLNRALIYTGNWKRQTRTKKERDSVIRLEDYLKGPGKSELKAA